MGLELEDKVGDVDEEKQNCSSTGDDEKPRSTALLDGVGLAGREKGVQDVIVNGLGHEIGGRDDERFCDASEGNENLGDQGSTH